MQMVKAIKSKDLWTAGTLLYQSHQSLSVLYEVSCPELDFLVHWASGQSNIYGARMMGGGFGGCTINLVQGELSDAQKSQLSQSYSESFGHAPEFIYIKPDYGLRAVL
jgi:galactokinase